MLNHEDWFSPSEPVQTSVDGMMPMAHLGKPEDRDGIAEILRKDFAAEGEVDTFTIEDETKVLKVAFRSEQRSTTAIIRRDGGQTEVTYEPADGNTPPKAGTVSLVLLGERENQLAIVETLRKDFAARGEVSSFNFDNDIQAFRVVFKSPGHSGNAKIERKDGKTVVAYESRGIVGVALDLHRGKDSGLAWSFVIDGVSILFVIISITGLILWTSLRSRAHHGIAVLLLGLAVGLAVYFVWARN